MRKVNYIKNLEQKIEKLLYTLSLNHELLQKEHYAASRRLMNMKLMDLLMDEVISCERGEKSLLRKFNTVEELAKEVKLLLHAEIDYSEKVDND